MRTDYIECCAECENITHDKNGGESCECSDEKCECHVKDWNINTIIKEIGYILTNDEIKLKLCIEQAEKKAKVQLAELISAMIGDRIFTISSGDVSRENASEIGDDICDYLKTYIIK